MLESEKCFGKESRLRGWGWVSGAYVCGGGSFKLGGYGYRIEKVEFKYRFEGGKGFSRSDVRGKVV